VRISVCMATYNGGKYITEQLESILSQLGENDEVVISDDGSSDNTRELVRGMSDSRIRLVINEGDKGYTSNFENALRLSSGDYIFLADQDDVWLPGKVNDFIKLFKHYDFIVSDCIVVDAQLNYINPSHFKIHSVKQGFIRNYLLPRYVGACMGFKRVVLQQALPFPPQRKYVAHDYWLSLIAELKFKVCVLDEPYLLYRRHSNNTSNGGARSKNSLYHKLMVRVVSGYSICKRYMLDN
jgi:glycosyltransferase involved in cell wall biosynthesis